MGKLRKPVFLAIALVGLMAAAVPGRALAISLEFDPVTQTVATGGQANVEVWLRELNGTLIGAYDISLSFDPSVIGLAAAPVVFGAGLGAPSGSVPYMANGAGSISVAEVSLLSVPELAGLQAGSNELLLFIFSFKGVNQGLSPLGFSGVVLSDEEGDPLDFTFTWGTATCVGDQPVIPEPGTLLLLGVGLAGLACLRRKSAARKE